MRREVAAHIACTYTMRHYIHVCMDTETRTCTMGRYTASSTRVIKPCIIRLPVLSARHSDRRSKARVGVRGAER